MEAQIKNGSNGKSPYDVFQHNIVKNVNKDKTEHVCQLPIELVETFIKASSNEGDIVFDPFMGSGTVAVASKKLGRNYLGCEIDKYYCKIINERLAKIEKPLQQFAFKDSKIETESHEVVESITSFL